MSFELLLDVFTSALAGGSAGAVAGWLAHRSRHHSPGIKEDDVIVLDPDLDVRIDEAAREWAVRHGRPGVHGILADKLRLGMRIRQRWQRQRRWSR